MDQKTKIVATLGPATESSEQLEALMKAGVDVFRFNLKHNTQKWHQELMHRVRRLGERLNKNIAILADLQGPELRTGSFDDGSQTVMLKEGQKVIFSPKPPKEKNGEYFHIPFNNPENIENLEPSHDIFIDDGKIELKTIKATKEAIFAKVVSGGVLGTKKSVSIPHAVINIPTLLEKDKKDVRFAIDENVDFIALSFVRDATDIATLRNLIKHDNGTQHIIAKIETLKSIENINEIIESADAIMVARGDLGIEIPIERVPKIQKEIIKKCREAHKPVIVATQMLQSMVKNAFPSRAEVADIANSVFDKSDALMLSEETATGDHPIKAVTTMAKIARYNEIHEFADDLQYTAGSFEEIIIASSISFSRQKPREEAGIKGYIVFTESGKSARVLSRFRPPLPIYTFTTHERVFRQLALSYGVEGFLLKLHKNPVNNIKDAISILKKSHKVEKGDRLIVIFGNNVGVPQANNTLSIVKV